MTPPRLRAAKSISPPSLLDGGVLPADAEFADRRQDAEPGLPVKQAATVDGTGAPSGLPGGIGALAVERVEAALDRELHLVARATGLTPLMPQRLRRMAPSSNALIVWPEELVMWFA